MTRPLISVGCDFGLVKSGIVLINSSFEIESQNLIRVKSRGAERLCDIERSFDHILKPYLPCEIEVFVEGYAYGAKYQRESLAELGGVMRRYLHLAKLSFWIIPPTSLKFFVTGTGKASKNYMKKCTKEQWDKVFKTDDVCDAYGMSRLGMHVMKSLRGLEGYSHLVQNQQDVIKEVLYNQEHFRDVNTATRSGKRKRRPNGAKRTA